MKRPSPFVVEALAEVVRKNRRNWRQTLKALFDDPEDATWATLSKDTVASLKAASRTYLPTMLHLITADVIELWASEVKYIAAVKTDDELNVTDEAEVSLAGNGAWVQAWVWVSNDQAGVQDPVEEKQDGSSN